MIHTSVDTIITMADDLSVILKHIKSEPRIGIQKSKASKPLYDIRSLVARPNTSSCELRYEFSLGMDDTGAYLPYYDLMISRSWNEKYESIPHKIEVINLVDHSKVDTEPTLEKAILKAIDTGVIILP